MANSGGNVGNLKAWTVAVLSIGLLLTGCSAGPPPIEQPGFLADKPLPSSSAVSNHPVDSSNRCPGTVKVIGLGNSGESGKPDAEVQAAYDALRMSLLRNQESDPHGLTDRTLNLFVPAFEGDTIPVGSLIDNPDLYGNDSYYPRSQKAANSIIDAIDTSAECSGSHVVLIGHGFGASAIRRAAASITPEQASHVSAVWLISDPNRNSLDKDTALFNGRPGDHFSNDGTAGGSLKFSGNRGTSNGFGPYFENKVASVCVPDDLECNRDQEFVLSHTRDKFIAKRGGVEALHRLEKPYTDPMFNVQVAYWVAPLVLQDVERSIAAKDEVRNAAQASPLQKYLTYVNHNAPGALVVQDEANKPDSITSCEADYAVIALRGSGENVDGSDKDENGDPIEYSPVDGVTYAGGRPSNGGPIIDSFTSFPATAAWKIKTELPSDKKIRFIPVKYAAVALEGTLMPNPKMDPQRYLDSATQGASMLQNKTLELIAKCPETKIVLVGYSQGAQGVHQMIHGADEATASKIAGVLLIADPLRRGDDLIPLPYDAKEYPNQFAPKGSKLYSTNGIMGGTYILYRLGLSKNTYAMPSYFNGKVVEICNYEDAVCNGGELFGDLVSKVTPGMEDNTIALTHVSVYRFGDHYEFPATWAAQKLMKSS